MADDSYRMRVERRVTLTISEEALRDIIRTDLERQAIEIGSNAIIDLAIDPGAAVISWVEIKEEPYCG